MRAEPVGPLPHPPAGSELPAALAGAEPGTVLLVTNDLMGLLGRGRLQPADVDVEVPVQVLQNGDGHRALVIPLAGSGATPLSPGRHRLTLAHSERWPTTDPTDDLSTYVREATITLDLSVRHPGTGRQQERVGAVDAGWRCAQRRWRSTWSSALGGAAVRAGLAERTWTWRHRCSTPLPPTGHEPDRRSRGL